LPPVFALDEVIPSPSAESFQQINAFQRIRVPRKGRAIVHRRIFSLLSAKMKRKINLAMCCS
jgi:hypothetical protein